MGEERRLVMKLVVSFFLINLMAIGAFFGGKEALISMDSSRISMMTMSSLSLVFGILIVLESTKRILRILAVLLTVIAVSGHIILLITN